MALQPGLAAALPLSIALHAALLYSASRIEWIVEDPRDRAETRVLHARVRQAPLLPRLPQPPEQLSAIHVPERPTRPIIAPNRDDELPPTRAEVPAPELVTPAPEQETAERKSAADETEPERPESVPPANAEATEPTPFVIDLEALRRDAVTQAIKELEREHRFSSDDSGEALESSESEPAESIFDAPRRSRRSALRPGQSRSAIGRWVSEICNELTGGIGLFGIGSLCAEPGPRADYFGHLRPSYLEKLPECAPVALVEPLPGAPGEPDITSTMKCRLVDKDPFDE